MNVSDNESGQNGGATSRSPLTSRLWIAAYILIGLIGVLRIAATHRVFSETLDEPAHIACGYDWLVGASYEIDPSHPPLARILSAIPALMQKVPHIDDPNFIARGNHILYFGDRYEHNLAAARRGNLLFFAVGMIVVGAWAYRLFGHLTAVLAMALFASLPPILAHAGVATTDISVAAMLPLALLLLERWLDRPSFGRAAALGTAIGLGLLSKFSFVVFFAVTAAVVIALRVLRRNARFAIGPAIVMALLAFGIVWGGYRFESGRIGALPAGEYAMTKASPAFLQGPVKWFTNRVPVPAPLFFFGAAVVKIHDKEGHFTYLLGETSKHGWWYYFPVVFFYKTPLPFLILCATGITLIALAARRSRREPLELLLIAAAIMLVVLPSSINIGIRHILPIYATLCIVAAFAVTWLWRRPRLRTPVVLLLAWMFVGTAMAHPDYLAWFNEAAGDHPERIVVDSNLDWGQDVLRLGRTVRELKIDRMWILYVGNALLERHGIVAEGIRPWTPAPGWYCLSETGLKLDPSAREGAYKWLDAYRMRRVGKSMRLYYVPECP